MRRTHLHKHENIAKRLLVHIAGLNLALLMRTRFGVGKPRYLQGRAAALGAVISSLLRLLSVLWRQIGQPPSTIRGMPPLGAHVGG
jgi:hypothetical protein